MDQNNFEYIMNKEYFKEWKKYVLCCVCLGFLVKAKKCAQCETKYCEKCIKSNKNKCEFECEAPVFKPLSGESKAILKKLKIKCRLCCEILEYDNYILHIDQMECLKAQKRTLNLDQIKNNLVNSKVNTGKIKKQENPKTKNSNKKSKKNIDIKTSKKNEMSLEDTTDININLAETDNGIPNLLQKYFQQLSKEEKSTKNTNTIVIEEEVDDFNQVKNCFNIKNQEEKKINKILEIHQTLDSAHEKNINAIVCISDSLMATGSKDGEIKVWVRKNNVYTKSQSLNPSGSSIKCLSKISDNIIVSGMWEMLIVWKVRNDKLAEIQKITFANISIPVVICIDNNSFISASSLGSICLWKNDNINTINFKKIFEKKIHSSEIMSMAKLDCTKIFTGFMNGQITLWEIGKEGFNFIQNLWGHDDCIWSLLILDEKNIVSSSGDKKIITWIKREIIFERHEVFYDHSNEVLCLEIITPTIFVSGSADKTMKIWQANQSMEFGEIVSFPPMERSVKFLKLLSENLMACVLSDNQIIIWNLFC